MDRAKENGTGFDVVCSCGWTFCFLCGAAGHEPATCAQMRSWRTTVEVVVKGTQSVRRALHDARTALAEATRDLRFEAAHDRDVNVRNAWEEAMRSLRRAAPGTTTNSGAAAEAAAVPNGGAVGNTGIAVGTAAGSAASGSAAAGGDVSGRAELVRWLETFGAGRMSPLMAFFACRFFSDERAAGAVTRASAMAQNGSSDRLAILDVLVAAFEDIHRDEQTRAMAVANPTEDIRRDELMRAAPAIDPTVAGVDVDDPTVADSDEDAAIEVQGRSARPTIRAPPMIADQLTLALADLLPGPEAVTLDDLLPRPEEAGLLDDAALAGLFDDPDPVEDTPVALRAPRPAQNRHWHAASPEPAGASAGGAAAATAADDNPRPASTVQQEGAAEATGAVDNDVIAKQNDEYLATHTKDCPNCYRPIEHDGGCSHMRCRSCGFEFCFVCLAAWTGHGHKCPGSVTVRTKQEYEELFAKTFGETRGQASGRLSPRDRKRQPITGSVGEKPPDRAAWIAERMRRDTEARDSYVPKRSPWERLAGRYRQDRPCRYAPNYWSIVARRAGSCAPNHPGPAGARARQESAEELPHLGTLANRARNFRVRLVALREAQASHDREVVRATLPYIASPSGVLRHPNPRAAPSSEGGDVALSEEVASDANVDIAPPPSSPRGGACGSGAVDSSEGGNTASSERTEVATAEAAAATPAQLLEAATAFMDAVVEVVERHNDLLGPEWWDGDVQGACPTEIEPQELAEVLVEMRALIRGVNSTLACAEVSTLVTQHGGGGTGVPTTATHRMGAERSPQDLAMIEFQQQTLRKYAERLRRAIEGAEQEVGSAEAHATHVETLRNLAMLVRRAREHFLSVSRIARE